MRCAAAGPAIISSSLGVFEDVQLPARGHLGDRTSGEAAVAQRVGSTFTGGIFPVPHARAAIGSIWVGRGERDCIEEHSKIPLMAIGTMCGAQTDLGPIAFLRVLPTALPGLVNLCERPAHRPGNTSSVVRSESEADAEDLGD